ncbi:hypothetical protein OB2597_03859 [Pseudooceanicola batsensis HTCC2597]|uniref:DUF2254 domain-containing protein n=2 Tax=Pseudooceanicola batsensis TaxID=314255 RepID=A3U3V5_PSEBH|nr:hypothetical protein OB2597_03859 [Pseudooceanicola batsensis HTCC2597]
MHEFSRRLIVRILLIALFSVIAIVAAKLLGGLIPFGLGDRIGADAVDHILSIIANSMLTVTTFSLTVMVASHRSVSSLWTPRAHQILLEDTTTHTVLATFVGAYLYAVITIILRETEVFKGEELVVLFFVTLLIVALIVLAIIRWISHLELLGSLIETASRTEERARNAYALRCDYPSLGGKPFNSAAIEDLTPVIADRTGYVQQIYQDLLQDAAEKADGEIHLAVQVGGFVHRGEVLGWVRGDCAEGLTRNVSIGSLRNYVQDPGFSILNLTEIAQRALSPGINDPGTAVDMTRRIARVLLGHEVAKGPREILHDRLYVPDLNRVDLMRESLGAIARAGTGHPEVVVALNGSLDVLSKHPDRQIVEGARILRDALGRAETRDPLDLSG